MKKAFILGLTLILGITPSYADGETLYCQGMVCSTTPPDPSKFANFDLKDTAGNTVTTIYGSIDYYTQPNVKTESNNTVCANCNIELQPEPIYIPPVVVETSTVSSDTSTVLIDTATVLSDTATATSALKAATSIEEVIAYIQVLLKEIYAIFEKLKLKG
jgi:hypothetical protein